MSGLMKILLGFMGIALSGVALAGYALPEMQVLLASGIPFCN